MSTCARGCCWTPWQACAQQRECACHWDDRKSTLHVGYTAPRHPDPTATQAIRNVMKQRSKP